MKNTDYHIFLLFITVTLAFIVFLPDIKESFADTIIDTIDIGSAPSDIAYNPSNEHMYVTSEEEVSVIDSATNTVIDTIPLSNARYIVYNSMNNDMYVATRSGTVSVIDSSTNTVIENITVSTGSIAYNPENDYLYVAGSPISFIDTHTNSVVGNITMDRVPVDAEYNPANGYVYITSVLVGSTALHIVDSSTNPVLRDLDVSTRGHILAYNPFNSYMYVGGSYGISLVDSSTNTVVQDLPLSCEGDQVSCVSSMEYNPDNNYMYAGIDISPDSIYMIDSSNNTVVDSLLVTQAPYAMAYNPFNKYMYIAPGLEPDSISVVAPSNSIEPPSNTAIMSAVDGLGEPIQNESSTTSNSITFNVQATAGTNPIDGFECSVDDSEFSKCANSNPATVTYRDLNPNMQHEFKVVAVDTEGNKDPSPATFIWTITESPGLQPIADAGPYQSVKSNDIVQLDGSNDSDPNGSSLTYQWNQTAGPEVSLSDSSSSHPTFTAPGVNEQTDLTFQLTVTNEEGIRSEPDEVVITISPLATPPPPEEPRTIGDFIKGIIQNPLNVSNSIDSANEIRDILTDDNRDNDQIVCDLIDSEGEYASNIREILNC